MIVSFILTCVCASYLTWYIYTERTCGALHRLATTSSMPRIAQTLTLAAKQCLDYTVSINDNDDIDDDDNTDDNDVVDTYHTSGDIRVGKRIPSDILEHSGEAHESMNSSKASHMHANASPRDTVNSYTSGIPSAHSDTVRSLRAIT
jgi:hypothetical protein